MTRKRKLQVFISSTFADLQEERQAAVEAILTAGHIPAGMELFTAGDESQMNVIKRWIDESDVYLLILGGRYGSIEPTSQKSYVQLEYDYAVAKEKPLFAILIDEKHLEEKVKRQGLEVIERERQKELREFRDYVLTKMVRFWGDPRDIKLAILETMSDFERRDELVGWISGDQSINSGAVVEEIARLTKENSELRAQLSNESASSSTTYNSLTFQQMVKLLSNLALESNALPTDLLAKLTTIRDAFGHSSINMLHFLWLVSGAFQEWQTLNRMNPNTAIAIRRLIDVGMIEKEQTVRGLMDYTIYRLTYTAKEFLLRMRVEFDLSAAEDSIVLTTDDFSEPG